MHSGVGGGCVGVGERRMVGLVRVGLVVATLALLVQPGGHGALGCGMTTHNVIAQRARQWFKDSNNIDAEAMIARNLDALQGGSPYPDYLYTCGSDHDAGEDTHWPRFQAAAAKYIHDKFPRPWSRDTEKLVVFLLGVTSHYIADINWHGLAQVPYGQGFLRTLGTQNYNCTGDLCSVAHTEGDAGGEFVAAYQLNLTFLHSLEWYVPTEDLVNIYTYAPQYVNRSANASAISRCSALFQLATIAIQDAGALAYPVEVQPAPFLAEQYMDFTVGGIDDNSVWSSFMWNRMVRWAMHGPPNGTLPQSVPSSDQRGDNGDRSSADGLASVAMGADLGDDVRCMRPSESYRRLVRSFEDVLDEMTQGSRPPIELVQTQRGVHVRHHPGRLTAIHRAMLRRRLAVFVAARARARGVPEEMVQRFERDISAAPLDRAAARAPSTAAPTAAEAAEGAPALHAGTSGADARPAAQSSAVVNDHGSITAAANAVEATFEAPANAYVGSALCTGDVDNDGSDDVVVGAPGVGGVGNPQAGAILIYKRKGDGLQLKHVMNSTGGYARFGAACAIGDVSGDGLNDLVVGAPSSGGKDLKQVAGNYTGRVHVYVAKRTGQLPPYKPTTTITTTTRWASLGLAVAVAPACGGGGANGTAGGQLLVGAPYHGVDRTTIHRGAVGVFHPRGHWPAHLDMETDADNLVVGNSAFAWLGRSITVVCTSSPSAASSSSRPPPASSSSSLLSRRAVALVSSPGYRTSDAGTVGQLVALNLPSADVRFVLSGTHDRAKFGWAAALADDGGKEVLLVSAPSMGKQLLTPKEEDKVMAGAVLSFDFATLHGDMTVGTRTPPLAELYGDADFAGLGWALKMHNASVALVGSPFHTRETGQVLAVDAATLTRRRTLKAKSPQHNARFGAALETIPSTTATNVINTITSDHNTPLAIIGAPVETKTITITSSTAASPLDDHAQRVGAIHTTPL